MIDEPAGAAPDPAAEPSADADSVPPAEATPLDPAVPFPPSEPPRPAPVAGAERVADLDVLRGFALLGILWMNVNSFAHVGAGYSNPTLVGDLLGADLWIYSLSYLFFNQKFMTLFSILFGAGVVLMTSRAEARTGRSAALHYRRMSWLLAIGLVHAYLIWYGDILVLYALCGMAIYPLRKVRPGRLVVLSVVLMAIPTLVSIGFGAAIERSPELAAQIRPGWEPSAEEMAREVAMYRGGWLDQMGHRAPTALSFQTLFTVIFGLWRAGGLMLLGIALYRWGVLTGERSPRFYSRLAVGGLALGLPLVAWGLKAHLDAGFSFPYSMFYGENWNYWAAPLVTLGYVGLVSWAIRSPRAMEAASPLAAVGRTAFSNYLLQSVLCTLIFYGHGLGLFARVARPGQLLVVLGIWALQLVVSPLWLRHYRFGPAEWLWRSLTYRRRQPMRRTEPAAEVAVAG